MNQHLGELLINATGPLAADPPAGLTPAGRTAELLALLSECNGFYAFNDALHVFPATTTDPVEGMTLQGWNANDLWRDSYGQLAHGHLFFAEDVFGGQFSILGDQVVTFDPETGDLEVVGQTIDEWIARLCGEDGDVLTGRMVADRWRQARGPLARGQRLVPVKPFVMGGDYAIDNLQAMESVDAMRVRGPVAQQLHELPDGTEVELTTTGLLKNSNRGRDA